MADLFGRLHTAGNGSMQSCEIILLHEGADLVGMHGFERVQQARGDALAADADAAQLMPDDAVRGQHAFRADLLVSQAAQSRGNAGRLIKCEQPAAAFGLIAAQVSTSKSTI